ncbi:hypothetical protein LTR78_004613 [Recurvomyces mirabilis]|uniref:Major facilitator superfamily (MFS) profile domain-containing protein n=1 Tax=Recurvomyces mirabilis TaxID=574656 RepID=A0AAE0WPP6_9PEZI|nr:hypothetical protein LTR78_004613 [Recurvomyces mirabilis]
MAAQPPAARTRRGWLARLLWPEDQEAAAAGFNVRAMFSIKDVTLTVTQRPQDYDRAITAILHRVDGAHAPFKWRVFLVAALGFLYARFANRVADADADADTPARTDSYNLFASNVVLPALSFVYWDYPGHKFEAGFNIATLSGSILGQIIFGIAVDIYGRRSLYGIELLIVIVATVGLMQTSQGLVDPVSGEHTWNITPWLYFWRVVMGLGIGAEYPLSACIAAEWSSTKTRGRMMAAVFLMQPFGQLLAYGVGLGALHSLDSSRISIDKFWRIVIGVGAAPTLLALLFRRNIPESWRYTYFVRKSPAKASNDLADVYGRGRSGTNSVELRERVAQVSLPEAERLLTHPAPTIANGGGNGDTRPPPPVQPPLRSSVLAAPGSQFKWSEIKAYLGKDKNWARLLGTSFCWFVLDVALSVFTYPVQPRPLLMYDSSYGMGFNSPGQIAKLFASQHVQFNNDAPWWQTNSAVVNLTSLGIINGTYADGTTADFTIKEILKTNMTHGIFITSIAAIAGSLVFVGTVHLLNRRLMLIATFFTLAGLLALTSGLFKVLFQDGANYSTPQPGGHVGLILLWAVMQFLFAFGPNTLTFIVSSPEE